MGRSMCDLRLHSRGRREGLQGVEQGRQVQAHAWVQSKTLQCGGNELHNAELGCVRLHVQGLFRGWFKV